MYSEPFLKTSSRYYTVKPIDQDLNIVMGITTRNGGVSHSAYDSLNMGFHVNDHIEDVLQNRRLLAEELNIPLNQWVGMEQVHGSKIYRVVASDNGRGSLDLESSILGTDGLFTSEKGMLLTAFYADCVPLFFYSKDASFVGLAHAGWRGSVNNIAGNMIELWTREHGIHPREVYVVIGPAIGFCCYEVDQKVIDQVDQAVDGFAVGSIYKPTHSGHAMLDLKTLNQSLLIKAGVPVDQISISTYCTSCRTDLFYSHRKENGKTGRMLSFIGLF